jgi:hypothetical protein
MALGRHHDSVDQADQRRGQAADHTEPDQTLLAKRSSGRGRVRSRVLSHGRTVVEVSTRRPLILNLSVGPWIPLSRR